MSQSINQGFNQLIDEIQSLADDLDKTIKKSINKVRVKSLRELKQNSRVDTGLYRNSWVTKLKTPQNSYKVILGNNVEYASFLEFGHRIASTNRWWTGDFTLKKTSERFTERLRIVFNKEIQRLNRQRR
jgi:hypothetical protein